jgi:hypothetical protein
VSNTILVDVSYLDLVPKWTALAAADEDVIFGDQLEEGMIVILTPQLRSSDDAKFSDDQKIREGLLEKNRWCEVTNLRPMGSDIYFIGLYADAQKMVRYCGVNIGWVVKKSSIPVRPEKSTEEE